MDIKELIPHREPFLFVDEIIETFEDGIKTQKYISDEESFFKGHYPDNPIMPGVLICECVFQSAALWISQKAKITSGTPVLTRIKNTKFKGIVKPDSTLEIETRLTEKLQNAWFMKGHVKVNEKKVLFVEFTVSLIED